MKTFAALALLACLFQTGPLLAEADTVEQGATPPGALHEATVRRLGSAQRLFEAQRHARALAQLRPLSGNTALAPYERAVAERLRGHILHATGRDREALQAFGEALAQEALPPEQTQALRLDAARLALVTEQYQDAIAWLDAWFGHGPQSMVEPRELRALAHYRLGECDDAMADLRVLIASEASPPEYRYRMLLSCILEGGDRDAAVELLEAMLRRFPDRIEYWRQLAAIHQNHGDPAEAAAVLQLAHALGLLGQQDLLHLARLYLNTGVPLRAARLLEEAMSDGRLEESAETWRLVTDGFILAREFDNAARAAGLAARLGAGGEGYVRLARIQLRIGQWEDAFVSLDEAWSRGGLAEPQMVLLMQGIAACRSGRTARGRQLLAQAAANPFTRQQALAWLNALDTGESDTDNR